MSVICVYLLYFLRHIFIVLYVDLLYFLPRVLAQGQRKSWLKLVVIDYLKLSSFIRYN